MQTLLNTVLSICTAIAVTFTGLNSTNLVQLERRLDQMAASHQQQHFSQINTMHDIADRVSRVAVVRHVADYHKQELNARIDAQRAEAQTQEMSK